MPIQKKSQINLIIQYISNEMFEGCIVRIGDDLAQLIVNDDKFKKFIDSKSISYFFDSNIRGNAIEITSKEALNHKSLISTF